MDGMTKEQWGALQGELCKTVGQNTYTTWIKPLGFEGTDDDGVLRLSAPTAFFGTYVTQNYGDLLLSKVSDVNPRIRRIAISAAANRATPAPQAATVEAPASAPARKDRDLPGAPLDQRFTFERFIVGKPNELAHAAAKRVAEGGPVTFNPLFLYGGVGLGKTHLMHAIAWELRERSPELTVLYLSAEQFMYRFVQALRERKMLDFKEMFRSVDILMVDDVQFIAGKESTQEEFFHTFNALVDQNKQIIISADRAPDEIKDLENRIRSRLQSGLVVDLHPTDYELRLGILQSKVETYREHYPRLEIADGVLEFLAHRISTNVRVLEGALTRLFAFASLVGKPIDMDLVQDSLSDVLRASERKVSIDEIQRKVAEHYNIRLSDMVGPKRVRNFARPRQVAMYLCKQLTSRSLPEIGRRFGGRDHTTVMHGVKRIEELRQQDGQIDEDVELLRRALEA
jgi:chromosomal replication initiator protein